ncbi:Glutathione transport system permease protein GsiC [Streptomyces lavendulae subsp. lavendulae]|uniref:Glutathione transport system permease protein GsiC n=1 Tax=Streptomyces lavendulae subsp. lavendulae TaxID=58340 RepID=A0A2K8P7F7_STRLA|nr:ABC transporter permease [Streptomyces lavendulae]ATZ22671.1 Glutathione transport system permease protein GsiC [Streptomyces lavendulae subsp. lavendulae]QUQ52513.1 Glutathione transport system permease protein GsiC [Streptomyces lavendulae subsp. lavendulae]
MTEAPAGTAPPAPAGPVPAGPAQAAPAQAPAVLARAGRVLRRLAAMAATLLVTSFLVFSSLYLAPGDPVSFLVRGRSPGPEQLAELRHQYGFDQPFLLRYWHWLEGVVQGDFGRSHLFHQDVSAVIWSRLPSSLLLVTTAALIIAVVGVGAGIVGALRRGTRTDRTLMLLVTIGAAAPAFVVALLLRSLLGVRLGWFPTIGNGSGVLDRLHHVVLPAIALAVTFTALVTRVTRSAMLDELRREHVEVALSRGTPRRTVIRRHVLRNALGPIVTVSALLVSGMLVSTAIVETAFGMSGVGSLLVQSVDQLDFQVVQAIVLLVVAAFVVVNALVDLLQPLIDPRTAAGGSAR